MWTIVMPLKGGPAAKSRLRRGLLAELTSRRASVAAPEQGPAAAEQGQAAAEQCQAAVSRLPAAIAADTLEAALSCRVVRQVIVVTADGATANQASAAGAQVVRQTSPAAGLNGAVDDGLRWIARARAADASRATADPGVAAADRALGLPAAVPGAGCAVLLGDLPALRPGDLEHALATAAAALSRAPACFVPDADGRGTVLLAAGAPSAVRPAFGPASAAAHTARGGIQVALAATRLRRDVDSVADLRAAIGLGVGPRTEAVVAALGFAARPTLGGCRRQCTSSTRSAQAAR